MNDSEALGKRAKTRAARKAGVLRAVHALEEQIAEPPDVAALAKIAGMSKFHFQRAFQAVVGETVNQHTGRLRVERAASYLKFSSWQAGDIALACGFQTQSSFGRCFRKFYGMSPQQFRKAEGTIPFLRGHARRRPGLELSASGSPRPTVSVEDWPDLTVVCHRYYGPVSGILQPWKELLSWAKKENPALESLRFLGLWFDDWMAKDDRYRYECAILFPGTAPPSPPAPFQLRAIPAGQVAVANAKGNTRTLDRAWHAFGTGWLPFSGYQMRTDFAIDEYPPELIRSHWKKLATLWSGLSLKMCLPVQTEPMEI